MKIDYELIDGYAQLGTYQAKSALAEYAKSTFNIKIQQNLSFENMKARLEEHVSKNSAKEKSETKFKITTIEEELEQTKQDRKLKIKADLKDPVRIDASYEVTKEDLEDKEIKSFADKVVEHNEQLTRKEELLGLLPPDFKPCFNPMGEIETFYPLSYWINDWIQETDNWMQKVNEYPRVQEHKFLYTLIYYIAINGQFTIRETRNSQFITLS